MTPPPARHLAVTRVVDAPRELVYRAFTRPDEFARWWGPTGHEIPLDGMDFDVRPGGHQRWTEVSTADPLVRVHARFDLTDVVAELPDGVELVPIEDAGPDPTALEILGKVWQYAGQSQANVDSLSQAPLAVLAQVAVGYPDDKVQLVRTALARAFGIVGLEFGVVDLQIEDFLRAAFVSGHLRRRERF